MVIGRLLPGLVGRFEAIANPGILDVLFRVSQNQLGTMFCSIFKIPDFKIFVFWDDKSEVVGWIVGKV